MNDKAKALPLVPGRLSRLDGRWLAMGMIVGYFALVAAMMLALHRDVGAVWFFLGVPALPQHFADLRDIAVGIERFQASGHSWSPESVAHAIEAYNYSKWWLYFGYLGLNLQTFYYFGAILCLFFFGASWFVLGKIQWSEGLVAGLVLTSPNIMTAIERGNGDLLIFILMALALGLRACAPLSALSIVLAAFLKLYPAAGLLAFIAPPWRKTLPWFAAGLVIFSVNVVTSLAEYRQIQAHVYRVSSFSFGSTTALLKLQGPKFHGAFDNYTHLLIIGSILLLLVIGISILMRPRVQLQAAWDRALFSFRLGTAIYIGTFALGSNFDQRSVVLIFCLPLLFILVREGGAVRHWAKAALLLLVLYTNWRLFSDDGILRLFILKQVLAWGLVACLAAIYAGTFRFAAVAPSPGARRA